MKHKIYYLPVCLLFLVFGLLCSPDNVTAVRFSWTVEQVASYGTFTSIDLDHYGYPHILYAGRHNTLYAYIYAYKDISGWHHEIVETVGEYLDAEGYTSLVLDSGDRPHICYIGQNSKLKYAYRDQSGWHIEQVTSDEGSDGGSCSIALDNQGRPHVVYLDYLVMEPEKHLKYAYRDASGWHIESIDDGHEADLCLDSNGYPHVSYFFSATPLDLLRYAYKDSTGWHIQNVDNIAACVQCRSSISVDGNNYPHISYYDFRFDDLKYAYKDAAGWHIETVDSAGYVGKQSSIALDSTNKPHISYYDATNNALKYAYKDDSGWHIMTVDSSGGNFTSLVLDSKDFPHISYGKVPLRYAYALREHSLQIRKEGIGRGTVVSNPPGINCGQSCNIYFMEGTVVSLNATPDQGSVFTRWSGDPDCFDGQVTMNSDKTCIAIFDFAFRLYLPLILKQ